MIEVHYFTEDISFDCNQLVYQKEWIHFIIQREKHSLISLNYIFCSDNYLHLINQEYLNHDTFTDIITFDQSEKKEEIEGDIFISLERVKENANQNNSPFQEELDRVIIHGVLHLCGYDDKSDELKKIMRQKEDEALSLRPLKSST